MARNARLEDRTEFTEDQLDALAADDNGIDAGAIADINGIRHDIAEEMSKAKMEGVLNEKDATELEREIQRSSADKKGMLQVANKVRSVIDENKNLIDAFVKGLTGERDVDNKLIVQDHVQRFKALSTEEKRSYVKNLRSNLDWVETLYKEILKHSPDKVDQFRKMTGKEKKSMVEDLQKRSKNIAAYRKLIEANGEHFSRESADEYMSQFKELKTVAEQERWISEFGKEVERKSEITKRFKAFPREMRDKFPDFFEARRNQKLIILQKMERAMEETHLKILNNDPNAHHFSEKDRAEAIKWWKNSTIEIRTLMLENLPIHLRKTAEMSKKYETMPDAVKLDVQQKMGFDNFYELSFDEKTKALEEGKRLNEHAERLTSEYRGKLREAVAKKYMSKDTHDAFMKEFCDLTVAEKTDWVNKFETHELAKRREVTERFQSELPKEEQQKNAAFYEMGYQDRVRLVAKLLGVDEKEIGKNDVNAESEAKTKTVERMSNEANRLERDGNNASATETKKEKWSDALKLYGKLLKVDPADEIARSSYDRLAAKFSKAFPKDALPQDDEEGLDQHEISAALERTKSGTLMQEKMKEQTIADELSELAAKSETYNANTFDSRRKNKHLGSEFDRALNEELQAHTGGEMVLDKQGKAEEIRTVDIKNIGKDKQEVFELKKEVVTHRGEKSQNVHHLQLNSRESGQILNARAGSDQADKRKAELQRELAERAAQALKASGKKLTAKDIAVLHEAAANDDLYVKLQEAA